MFSKPDDFLFNLQAMSSQEAKRLFRRSIFDHFGCRCAYCDKQGTYESLTLDHIKPRSKGGQYVRSNLIPACPDCNRNKGSRNWLQWFREVFPNHCPERESLILNWST